MSDGESRLSLALGLVYDDAGNMIGRVTDLNIAIRDRVPGPPRKALLVAPQHSQAMYWADEMGMLPVRFADGQATPLAGPATFVRERGRYQHALPNPRWIAVPWTPTARFWPDWPRVDEAFFVGEWGRMNALAVARLMVDLDDFCIPVTHVCSALGEAEARKAEWVRWLPRSGRKMTAWHVFEERGFKDDTFTTLCGLAETRKFLVETPDLESQRRYGRPPAACGVCAHQLERRPPTPPSWMEYAAESSRRMGAAAARTTISLEEFGRVWDG